MGTILKRVIISNFKLITKLQKFYIELGKHHICVHEV